MRKPVHPSTRGLAECADIPGLSHALSATAYPEAEEVTDGMAGSLAHLIDENGAFTMRGIDNLGDAHEACEECFDIIAYLLKFHVEARAVLAQACRAAKAPMPEVLPVFRSRRVDQ